LREFGSIREMRWYRFEIHTKVFAASKRTRGFPDGKYAHIINGPASATRNLDQIRVEAPASSANLGPGFDVFAIALDKPRDAVRLRIGSSSGARGPSVKMASVTGLEVPRAEAENGACIVCLEMAKQLGVLKEITVDLEKKVPIGRGMGSSGASAAAAAVAMNELLELGLTSDELIFYAGKGEAVMSGSPHYDNVSASILGGFVVVRGGDGERPTAVRFEPPPGLAVCVATPSVSLPRRKTEYARSLLPESVPLGTLVANVANAGLMVSGFAKKDIELIGRGMTDKAVEQARKSMIPGYDRVRTQALGAGAAGVCISGAGPSMLAIVDKKRGEPAKVLEAMLAAFGQEKIKSSGYVTRIGKGARVCRE
jgi:homoserine kinase